MSEKLAWIEKIFAGAKAPKPVCPDTQPERLSFLHSDGKGNYSVGYGDDREPSFWASDATVYLFNPKEKRGAGLGNIHSNNVAVAQAYIDAGGKGVRAAVGKLQGRRAIGSNTD